MFHFCIYYLFYNVTLVHDFSKNSIFKVLQLTFQIIKGLASSTLLAQSDCDKPIFKINNR